MITLTQAMPVPTLDVSNAIESVTLASGDAPAAFEATLTTALARPVATTDVASDDGAGKVVTTKRAVPVDVIVCEAPRRTQDDDDAIANADAATELAAQLALVSQWTAVARPVADQPSTDASTATTASVSGAAPASTRDRLAALRADVRAADDGRAVPVTTARMPIDGTTTDLATAPSLPATLAQFAATIQPKRTDVATTATSAADRPVTNAAAPALPVVASTVAPDATPQPAVPVVATPDVVPTALVAPATTPDQPVAVADAVRQPVGTAGWSHELGQATLRIATIATAAATGLKEAQLKLNPEHLGPLDVRVRIDDGVAHLAFRADHVDTRQALEASRPVLDQLFANQGLTIGDCSIADAGRRDADAQASAFGDPSRARSDAQGSSSAQDTAHDDATLAARVASRLARPLGLVDTFA